MKITTIALSLALPLVACVSPIPPPAEPAPKPPQQQSDSPFENVADASISYFKGNALVTSSDTRIIYGLPKIAMMRRAVVPRDNRIVEEVISEVGSFILVITGDPAKRIYEATTPSGKKVARVEFEGHPYSTNRWRYLSNDEPPKVLIKAVRSLESLKMMSTNLATNKEDERLTTWELTEVTRERYQQMRQDLIEKGIFRNKTPEWELPGS